MKNNGPLAKLLFGETTLTDHVVVQPGDIFLKPRGTYEVYVLRPEVGEIPESILELNPVIVLPIDVPLPPSHPIDIYLDNLEADVTVAEDGATIIRPDNRPAQMEFELVA